MRGKRDTGLRLLDLCDRAGDIRGLKGRAVFSVTACSSSSGLRLDDLQLGRPSTCGRKDPIKNVAPTKRKVSIANHDGRFVVVYFGFMANELSQDGFHGIGSRTRNQHTMIRLIDGTEFLGNIFEGLTEGSRHEIFRTVRVNDRIFKKVVAHFEFF